MEVTIDMKRRVLCVISFLLIILVFFTFVSPEVEDEMATLVDARKRQNAGNGRSIQISTIALLWRDSDERIYSISEGKGWESGLRLSELSPMKYKHESWLDHVELAPGDEYWYVYSASRTPVLGGAVKKVTISKGEDTYLIWSPEAIAPIRDTPPTVTIGGDAFHGGWIPGSDVTIIGPPPEPEPEVVLPNSMDLISQKDNVALVSINAGNLPFFEHSVWYTFRQSIGEDVRIYSLNDVHQLTSSLPWIAGVGSALVCSMILCASAWIVTSKKGYSKKILLTHVVLIAVLLASLPLLLKCFDLPASLMPSESILDISHYAEELGRIRESMALMEDATVDSLLSSATAVSVLVAAICITAVCIYSSIAIFRTYKKSK